MTRTEVIAAIEKAEKEGRFHDNVDPVDYSLALGVDEHFPYLWKGWYAVKVFFERLFVVKPFIRSLNKKQLKTVVYGRENLKGIDSAVVTCNHVYMFDCLAATYALDHKIRITAAWFNNRNDQLGEWMRAGGMISFAQNLAGMRKFNEAVHYYLQHKHYVMFYPEQEMWYQYEKPRPYQPGAFKYAVKEKVPVIPIFITFRNTDGVDEEGLPNKQFFVHIMPAIYAKPEMTDKENVEYLRVAAYESCVKKYEEFYGKKLVYTCDQIEKNPS